MRGIKYPTCNGCPSCTYASCNTRILKKYTAKPAQLCTPFNSVRMRGSGGGGVRRGFFTPPPEKFETINSYREFAKKKTSNPIPYNVKNYPFDLPSS